MTQIITPAPRCESACSQESKDSMASVGAGDFQKARHMQNENWNEKLIQDAAAELLRLQAALRTHQGKPESYIAITLEINGCNNHAPRVSVYHDHWLNIDGDSLAEIEQNFLNIVKKPENSVENQIVKLREQLAKLEQQLPQEVANVH